MLKSYITMLLAALFCVAGATAQVTSEPAPLQEDSQDVTIFFHADQGNKGLMGLGPTAQVYAHTGACLSNGQNWQNAPTWGDNADKYRLEYVSENLWKLYIGDIRTYYNITDPNVNVTKLAFVFRTADKRQEGKGPGNSDIFIDVLDSGLQVSLTSSIEGSIITSLNNAATFTVSSTKSANLVLTLNGVEIAAESNAKSLTAQYEFSEPGNYTLTATATADSETVSQTLSYVYLNASPEVSYPGGTPVMGPVRNADGSVTFCIGAPQKESVMIVGAWNDYAVTDSQVMNRTDVNDLRYFWLTIPELENDRQYGYYFIVDGQTKVGDPYARLVLDPYNDKYLSTDVYPDLPAYPDNKISNVPLAVYQGNINDYDWQVTDFKGVAPQDLIIYELLLRDFTGTEGKALGNGTIRQAIEKIPYLKQLGVNAIELLPINEFNGNNSWGYNPNFYFAPDKAYGTPDDYKEFIDLCHLNGMAVILDMVFNQSDGMHPWYQMYMPGENPFYNLNAPHAYSVLNDWNQGFPMVQEQWHNVLRYWLTEYRVDGFRFDLVKGLGNNDSYSSNSDAATNAFNASRIARMKELKAVVDAVNPNAYFINENLATAQEENDMAADGELNWANLNYEGQQYAMGYESNSGLNRFYAPKDSRTWGSTVSYLESHDEERLAYVQNQNGATGVKGNLQASMGRLGSAAAQMILAPGAHMIWQFSELGNYDTTKNGWSNNTDPKTVRWNLFDSPVRRGLYDSYAELIAIRNENPDLFSEEAQFENNCSASNWAQGRTMVSKSGDKELFTVINPNVSGNITVSVNFNKNDDASYAVLSKTYSTEPSFSAQDKTVTLPANSYVVIGSTAVAEVDGIEGNENALRAYAAQGAIVVDYAEAPVKVYALDGTLAATLTEPGRVELAAGVYVLRSGSNALKLKI